ncbi:MAG TPA: ATP-binding protein [Terriglobales bacterium]|nr:ATP-binding protein [Terriglobales bacterium]
MTSTEPKVTGVFAQASDNQASTNAAVTIPAGMAEAGSAMAGGDGAAWQILPGQPDARMLLLLAGQNDILDMIARGLPRQQVFDRLTEIVDEVAAPALSSILLVDNGRLYLGAAPNLSKRYCDAIEGVVVGDNVGSCGTAVFLKKPIVAANIATDPRWADYRDYALAAGLQACWSLPILTEAGEAVATFALYYREPREPAAADWHIISSMARLVRVAIERDRHESALRAVEQSLRTNQTELQERVQELEATRSELQAQATRLGKLTVDLTAARNEAVAADRLKTRFLANMSHELRTPLNAIIGFSDVMRGELMGALENPTYRGYVRDIYDSGSHLLKIINEVLDLAKIEAGQMTVHAEAVSLQALCTACIRLMELPAEQGKLALRMEVADHLPIIYVDQLRLKQALINLLSNAIKFTTAGGEVCLKAWQDIDGDIKLQVCDSGIGMTEAEMRLALEPFRQVDNDLARKYEGSGLGLPLAKAFVELQNGTLVLASARGEGTIATITLPRSCLQQAVRSGEAFASELLSLRAKPIQDDSFRD